MNIVISQIKFLKLWKTKDLFGDFLEPCVMKIEMGAGASSDFIDPA